MADGDAAFLSSDFFEASTHLTDRIPARIDLQIGRNNATQLARDSGLKARAHFFRKTGRCLCFRFFISSVCLVRRGNFLAPLR